MSDSTPNLSQVASSQSQKEVTINGLFDAVSPAGYGARHAETCSGLTWGYYGGRWGGDVVANGTLALQAMGVNYVVLELATGEISLTSDSDSDAAWDDPAFARLYAVTTGPATVTGYDDYRVGPGGLYGTGVGGGAADLSEATGDLGVEHLNGGTDADETTFWRGDGVWAPIEAGDASAVVVNAYTSSGTWTKPAGAKVVRVILYGAGGGGGGGANRNGGNGYAAPGGGGGARIDQSFPASTLGGTEDITIGTGGAGGAGTNTSQGGSGSIGGNSIFGTTPLLTAYAGGGGGGGGAFSYGTGSGGGALGAGAVGTSTANTPGGALGGSAGLFGNAAQAENLSPVGGASGGSSDSNNAGRAGGSALAGGNGGGGGGGCFAGGQNGGAGGSASPHLAAGTAGVTGSTGTSGGDGNTPTNNWAAGTGGGGGGQSTGAAGPVGGAGGRASGGGGGGSTTNSTNLGGNGGAGGNGYAVVITYF